MAAGGLSLNGNLNIDIKKAKKHAFKVRLVEVFSDGLFTQAKWNVLFVLCCLPVVTFGCAVAALYNCTNLLVSDDRPQRRSGRLFLNSFKAAVRGFFMPSVLFTLANAVFLSGFAFYLKLTSASIIYVPLASAGLIALAVIWAVAIHLLPELFETDLETGEVAVVDMPLSQLVKTAAEKALINGKKTAVVLVLDFVLLAVQLLLLPITVPVILVIGMTIPAQLAAFAHTEPEIID